MSYWDASGLLKLYLQESNSLVYRGLAAQSGGPFITSAIADTEVLCAFLRKERMGDIPQGAALALLAKFRADVAARKIVLVPYGIEVQYEADHLLLAAVRQKQMPLLRALDAIHIASAMHAKATALITADERMRDFAGVRGIRVAP